MKEVFSQNLRSARKIARLSMDALASKVGISKQAISKYEKGMMLPDGKVLISLARVLGVKSDFFFRSHEVVLQNIEYRKRKRLGKKDVESIKEQAADFLRRYLELERILRISSKFRNPLAGISIESPDGVEEAANELRKRWKLGNNPVPNVIEILEDHEIKVYEIEEEDNFDGFCGKVDGMPLIVMNKRFDPVRKRLTALHELAHLLLQLPPSFTEKERERYCMRFAAAFLIPKEIFFHELGEIRKAITRGELIGIKENYGISVQAIMQRAKDLGVISDQYFVQFRISIAKNRKEEGLGDYKGKEKSSRFRNLLNKSATEEIISMSKAANLANMTLSKFREEFQVI